MPNSTDIQPFSPGFARLATAFRLLGWMGFWIKLVLVVVSSGIALFAVFFSRNPGPNTGGAATANPTTGFGLFLVVCGIIMLGASVFWSFRYTRWGRRFLVTTPKAQPSKAATVKLIKIALITDLIGMLLTVIGGEWVVGELFGKAVSQGIFVFNLNPNRLVEPLDLLVVQSCINTLAGQFVGIASSLWLLEQTTQVRPSQPQ